MVYWYSRSITSSFVRRHEVKLTDRAVALHDLPCRPGRHGRAATGLHLAARAYRCVGRRRHAVERPGFGPYEIISTARSDLVPSLNLTSMGPLPDGGHFAALEVPELLAADIRAHFDAIAL